MNNKNSTLKVLDSAERPLSEIFDEHKLAYVVRQQVESDQLTVEPDVVHYWLSWDILGLSRLLLASFYFLLFADVKFANLNLRIHNRDTDQNHYE